MEYQAKLQYDSSLIHEALFGFWRRTVTRRFLVVLVVSLAFFAYLWLEGDRSWLIGAFGAVLTFAVIIVVAIYFTHAANMKRKLKDMGSPEATFNASESSFTVASGAGSSTVPWSTVTDVWKLEHCWLLLFSRAQFMTLPLHDMSDEMRSFILQRIAAAGGKINGQQMAQAQ